MGEPLANGSEISTTDIVYENTDDGEEASSLVCHTDRPDCCQTNGVEGEWYLPGGSPASDGKNFVVTRSDDGTIDLNYENDDVMSPWPIGLFCCTVPDAVNVIQTVCIDIG